MMQRRISLGIGLIVLFLLFVACPEGFAREEYRVASGDTLSGIAKKRGVSARALRTTNKLKRAAIKPGQILVVPHRGSKKRSLARKTLDRAASSRYVVKKGDTLSRISKKTGIPLAQITALNHIHARSLKVGTILVLSRHHAERRPAQEYDAGCEMSDLDCEEEGDEGNAAIEATAANDEDAEKAELLGKWRSTEERQLLVKVATGFLGAPYRLGGSSVRGLDCSAFVKKIYDFFGVTLPRTAHEQARLGIRVLKEELEAGDLVFFNTRRLLGHVGIYIGNNEFVHASSRKRGVRIDSLETPYYNRHFVKAVRLKGLDGGV
ncbi:MAG: C40 family peptidase [Deltaproteobacteria bacterium]|nr:C40 family peptidase [Deltaproteobacteria bacterium]